MSKDEGQEEYEEVQADLKKREDEVIICPCLVCMHYIWYS